jgi:ATP adenylyltransferase
VTQFDHLWAAWRSEYVGSAAEASNPDGDACVFCRIFASGVPDDETFVVWRGGRVVALLNAYPYTTGHLLVMPERHVAELEDLTVEESTELWSTIKAAVRALKVAYKPDGLNVGANLGRAGGAGVPGHFHMHVLPRWHGDTNFMTAIAGVRVMPEALPTTWRKVRDAWPTP